MKTHQITSHDMTWHLATNHIPSPRVISQPTTKFRISPGNQPHQNRSPHHHHGTAEGSFTQKTRFGHRSGWSPCAHSIGKFFLWLIVFFLWNFRPRLARLYLYYTLKKRPRIPQAKQAEPLQSLNSNSSLSYWSKHISSPALWRGTQLQNLGGFVRGHALAFSSRYSSQALPAWVLEVGSTVCCPHEHHAVLAEILSPLCKVQMPMLLRQIFFLQDFKISRSGPRRAGSGVRSCRGRADIWPSSHLIQVAARQSCRPPSQRSGGLAASPHESAGTSCRGTSTQLVWCAFIPGGLHECPALSTIYQSGVLGGWADTYLPPAFSAQRLSAFFFFFAQARLCRPPQPLDESAVLPKYCWQHAWCLEFRCGKELLCALLGRCHARPTSCTCQPNPPASDMLWSSFTSLTFADLEVGAEEIVAPIFSLHVLQWVDFELPPMQGWKARPSEQKHKV